MFEIFKQWRLLFRMVERDLRSKYVGSLIGVFWTIINPLLLLLVFTFIFAIVFRARFGIGNGVSGSALYILAGLIPWLGFQEGVARSASCLLENRSLVSRVKFPIEVLPPVPVLSAFFGQMVGFVVLLFWAGASGRLDFPAVLFLPAWMVLQLAFALGLGYLFSAAAVWGRDLLQIIPVLLLVWMYATPIFYPATLVPENFQVVVQLNPLAALVNGYRSMILEGKMPGMNQTLFLFGAALITLVAGFGIFSKLKKFIADRI